MLSEKIITQLSILLAIVFTIWNIPFLLLTIIVALVVGTIVSILHFLIDLYRYITKRKK